MMVRRVLSIYLLMLCTGVSQLVQAETIRIAVASNFSATIKELASKYGLISGHNIIVSSGSTGKLFAQIVHGAPYDIFLSADAKRADLLVKKGLAKTSKTYAYGQLVYIAKDFSKNECRQSLNDRLINKLSLANPKTAPYGVAASQVLIKLGKWDLLRKKIVMGENVLQAYQFVVTGSASAGFVAKSTLLLSKEVDDYCQWDVPANLYQPIRQNMVLLNRAEKNIAARAFFRYINSGVAKNTIKENGYFVK